MAKTFSPFVCEVSNTTGLGPISLGGAKAAGFFTFRQGYPNGNPVTEYTIVNKNNTKVEHHRNTTLTYGSPDQLSRNVWRSTNNDAAIDWTTDDLPLTVMVPASADVHEGAVTAWLGAARHALIRLGLWAKSATPAAGFHRLTWQDGADAGSPLTSAGDIGIGIVNETSHEATIYGLPPGYLYGLTLSRPSVSTRPIPTSGRRGSA